MIESEVVMSIKNFSRFAVVSIGLCLAIGATAQTSVALKLKLREDETVRYRHILNATTYTPNDINERVASGIMAFTFGGLEGGRIPVKFKMEDYEGLDAGTNGSAEGMRQVDAWFDMDRWGNAGKVSHKVGLPGLAPIGVILERSIDGMMSLGFMGWHMPEEKIQQGHKWTQTVLASDFLGMVFAPAGNAFEPHGDLEATFSLVDVMEVNKKQHARISVDVVGEVEIDLHFPPNDNSGGLTVKYSTALLVDLETGLVTRSKTDGIATIDIEGFQIQVIVSELLYKLPG